ncbi:hypothetical protein pb186bvf_008296 [Paramecium bursaria]
MLNQRDFIMVRDIEKFQMIEKILYILMNQNNSINLICEFREEDQIFDKQILKIQSSITIEEFLSTQKHRLQQKYKYQIQCELVFQNKKYNQQSKSSFKDIGIQDGSAVQIKTQKLNVQQNNNQQQLKQQKNMIIVDQDKGIMDYKIKQFLSKPQVQGINNENFYKIQYQIQQDIKDLKKKQLYSPYQKVPVLIDIKNPELLFHIIDDQLRQSNYKVFWSLDSEAQNIYSLQCSFFRGLETTTCLSLSIQEIDTLTYSDLQKNKEMQNYLVQQVKSIIINHQQAQDVLIHSIEQGSIKINFIIINPNVKILQVDKIKTDILNIYPNSNPIIELFEYFNDIKLSVQDFNPQYNIEWPEGHPEYDWRGPFGQQQKYFFPLGWDGFALNLKNHDLYDDGNDDWLKMDLNPNQWRIMYHGTKVPSFQKVFKDGIIQLREQKYKEIKVIDKQQFIGSGILLTNHIEVCEQFCNSTFIGDIEFKMAFQSRVYPNGLKQIQKQSDIPFYRGNIDWDNDYYFVNHPSHLRPYRILIKMIGHKKKNQPQIQQNNPNNQQNKANIQNKHDCQIQ